MKPRNLVVRCMAWKEDSHWVAVCLDFTLAAQGNSLSSAKDALHGQIRSYVNEALTIDQAYADDLLERRAPLRDRLLFDFAALVYQRPRIRAGALKLVRALHGIVRAKLPYKEPLPLQAA